MKRPLRLVTVGHSYVVGLNRRLAHEMSAQANGEWEVTAVAPRYFHGSRDLRPVLAQPDQREPVRVEFIPAHLTRKVHAFYYGRGLRKLLEQADLVHCWEEPFIVAGAQTAWLTPHRTPLVFATFQNLSKRYPPPFNWLERYAMRRATGWIALSQSVVGALASRPIYSRRPMCQIYMGVDLRSFYPDPQSGASTRALLGWEADGPPVVGYLGRFTKEKGIDDLMAALDTINAPWRAIFVGAGPMQNTLRQWAARHGDRVRICTDVAHAAVPRYLNAMDLLVAPSRTTDAWREQFGRMLIEAFACGVPVIGSNSGEIPHVISDAGLVVPEQSPMALSAQIAALIDGPLMRRELGSRGLIRAREFFSWAGIARQHLKFFQSLMSG
jgi:phosphatidylinositol alpha-1,6-mannosyltransferase